jgi:hypothetical protein
MPPKQQTSITSFFGQQLQRPLPFTSPDPHRDGDAVMPETPSQRRSQSPGVIVPGTPPTPFSLEAQSVPRSASPRFVPDYTDHQVAHANRGLSAQFPPQVSGPTLSPSSGTTAEYFAAQQAYQQFADAQQQQQQQQQQQEQEDPDKAAARQRAAIQAQMDNPDVLTQFQGGKTRSKMVKKSKKSKKSKKLNKRTNRRSRSRSRSKKSYFY